MITTIAFDYGRVLAYPATGHWFITTKTSEIMGTQLFQSIMSKHNEANNAFQVAQQYLNDHHLLHTEAEEIAQFTRFYELFLAQLKVDNKEELSKRLAIDIVCNDDKVIFWDDVYSSLIELKKHYRIAILSDTWPSLKRILANKCILPILDALIMSCNYNETKGGTKLFEITAHELQEEPNNILFVDDSLSNLSNAENSGFVPVLMDRDNQCKEAKYPIVRDMKDVQKLLQRLAL